MSTHKRFIVGVVCEFCGFRNANIVTDHRIRTFSIGCAKCDRLLLADMDNASPIPVAWRGVIA